MLCPWHNNQGGGREESFITSKGSTNKLGLWPNPFTLTPPPPPLLPNASFPRSSGGIFIIYFTYVDSKLKL
jgi:hypothetical protein